MRKLKLQMQISVDGFVAGPAGEMDWMVWNWGDDIKKYVIDLTDSIDCILLGRKLAQGFIPHWTAVAEKVDDPEVVFARNMCDTPKVVFSKTLDRVEWKNTALAKGDLVEEIRKLKNQPGKDIIVYGGGTFVSSLINARLIDEFHLFLNPSALGEGMTIFKGLKNRQDFALKKSATFDCGIVLLCYERK